MTKEIFFEEEFHREDKKASRKERNRVRGKDRSRFKKSDQDQRKKRLPLPDLTHLLKGRVIALVSDGIFVQTEDKKYLCSLKGTLKHLKEKAKNLVAVGDIVYFEEGGNSQGMIVHIEERFSVLSRADHLSQHKEQLIAVNIDQVFITASVVSPPLKPFLIDRYIIAAEKGNLKPIILINKIDLLKGNKEEKTLYDLVVQGYKDLKITVVCLSIKTKKGLRTLKRLLRDKTSVFSGQSGTGKSSIINALAGTRLSTGAVVERTKKGSHTTTTTELIPLSCGGWCVDTPGVQSFGLWDIAVSDIASYYPEITALQPLCKYADCAHLNETECAVRKAAEEGQISPLRFASYCALMASASQTHHPR